MTMLSVPHPILALAYRHAKVWARRLPVFLAMYIVGPVIMLYGLGKAFGIQDQLAFILPGIMANSVAASGFINCSYGAMERFFNKRYEGWMAATMTVRQIMLAEALFQSFKGLLTATGIWLASLLLGGSLAVGAWAASLPVMMLVGWCAAMLGYTVVALARNYDDIALSEPFMSAAFVFSGVFVVITQFPLPLQVFGMLLPIYHGVEAARPLFLGQPEAATYLLHMLILAGMCVVTTVLAIKLFQRRLMD